MFKTIDSWHKKRYLENVFAVQKYKIEESHLQLKEELYISRRNKGKFQFVIR